VVETFQTIPFVGFVVVMIGIKGIVERGGLNEEVVIHPAISSQGIPDSFDFRGMSQVIGCGPGIGRKDLSLPREQIMNERNGIGTYL
jgi:hypothetical protein